LSFHAGHVRVAQHGSLAGHQMRNSYGGGARAVSLDWLTQEAGRGRTVTSSSFSTPFTTVFCTLLGLRSNGRQ